MVKLIFSDAKARAEFNTDTERVMSQFDLSNIERKAVLASRARLGLVSGNSAVLNYETGILYNWN